MQLAVLATVAVVTAVAAVGGNVGAAGEEIGERVGENVGDGVGELVGLDVGEDVEASACFIQRAQRDIRGCAIPDLARSMGRRTNACLNTAVSQDIPLRARCATRKTSRAIPRDLAGGRACGSTHAGNPHESRVGNV